MARAGDVTVAGRAPSALTISFGHRPGRVQLWHPGEQIVVEHHVGPLLNQQPGWRPARALGVIATTPLGWRSYDETSWWARW